MIKGFAQIIVFFYPEVLAICHPECPSLVILRNKETKNL